MNDLHGIAVLLVEDDFPGLDAFEFFFADSVDFHTAQDGRSAPALITSGFWPDVIVCDYRMPSMNGVEFVERAREFVGREIPAIIISGDTSSDVIEASNLAHCSVLRKPFDATKLIALINIAVSRN